MSEETNVNADETTATSEKMDAKSGGDRHLFAKPRRAGEETVWDLMYRAIYQSVMFLLVFAVLSAIAGYMFSGILGVWSALVAIVAVVLLCLTNPVLVAVLSRMHLRPAAYLTWFLLGWMVKIGIVVVILLGVQHASWLNPKLSAVFMLIGAAVILAAEIHTAATSRVPYVDPPVKRDRDDD
ncbi:hypothetical protein [Bifidobacterium vansinderenii]|uniref:Uncharacterized protein n=1 Tax=Bifidobacterium vansinderenii TaxID=1984871 RepID=A0A229VZP4_9BIFI|nr:hypothetical protein [Bifidobacterium vansinderenii]OXN01078.1 hypothetical protein Tam10B_0656 [Bifidobacterium vansinderenii]